MQRVWFILCGSVAVLSVVALRSGVEIADVSPVAVVVAQTQQNGNVPEIPFTSVPDYFRYSPDMNLGETLGVAVNSKGHVVVLNHPGTATSGPLYGNATTQLLEFDNTGQFVREIGKGVYGLGYAHSVRFDKYDNLWVVDKGTNSAMKFNPAGYVVMNLGRRPEGFDSFAGHYHRPTQAEAVPRDGYFDGPTDVAWDADDNIFISDGYINSRVAKFDKNGNWIRSFGSHGRTEPEREPGKLSTPHNMQVDRQGNVYVADRGNRRIQVFDNDGNFLRIVLLNVPYDKTRQPVLGDLSPNRPDETAPWSLCISQGPTQYLWTNDVEPGRIYKMTLDGKILGMLGESGRGPGQFNWVHGLDCSADDVLYVADMNNWRVQKLLLGPEQSPPTAAANR